VKYYVAVLALLPAAFAQQRSVSSHTFDVNGQPMAATGFTDVAGAGAERKATTVRNMNGRNVPVESVEEHVVSNAGGVRVIERTIKRYDANGMPGPAEKVRIEERKNADGSGTVLTTVMRGDINGNMSLAERSTADIRKSGDTTTTTTTIERSTVNGTFDTVGKREETERKSANGDLNRNATIYQRDMNGRLYETGREEVQQTKRGDVTEENAARYEATNGQLQLVEQKVSRTTKTGPAQETEVNVFQPELVGRAQPTGARPQLREQQIIEKRPAGNGTVETMSVRWATPNAPGRLGPAQKVQETTCSGDCK
jgi:hypothetical protein